jgi:predicted RNA-binding protein YlqC (UPF0109 family)
MLPVKTGSTCQRGGTLKDLIEYIALSLVDDPSQVFVKQERGGGKMHFELRVAKSDMGRVIGKSGRVANAMRILLRVAAAREGKQAILDVVEPR